MSIRPSVCRSVRWSVRGIHRSVTPFLRHVLGASCAMYPALFVHFSLFTYFFVRFLPNSYSLLYMLLTLRYLLASRLHFAHFSFDYFCLNSSIAFVGFRSYFLTLVTSAFARLVIDSLKSFSLESLYTLAQILAPFSLNFSLTSCLLLAQLFADFLLDSSFTSCSIIRLLLVQFFTRFCTCFLRAI